MADRVVSVSIRAEVSNFLTNSAKVRQAAEQTATAAQKLEKQHQAFEKVGAGITTIGVAAAAAVAIAVKSFADFDAQMSQVQSLSHATASEMDRLRNAALTMGQGIGFSATEVADAETELVKAGISVKDILGGGLKGALSLAAAGQIEVGRATEIAASAMTQFGLKGKDVPHIADLLAAGADKALGGVEQLGQALQQSGLVANQFGLSIDETVGTLAEFAQNGLMGSDAGTSLKQMFLQLATPTKQATDAMKKYHISAYDAQGDFVGITALAGQLEAGFKGVDSASRDSALGIIFGSDAIRAANILMNDGAAKNEKWIRSVNAAGFAAAQAAGKTDNLNGDVKKLGAALESGLIKSGSASNEMLRSLTQNATGFVQAIGNAPEPLLGLGLGLTALVAATALAGGGFLSLVPKIAAAKAAMKDLRMTGGTVARGFLGGTTLILGIAAVTSAIANLGSEAELSEGQLRKLNAAMTASNPKSLNQQFVGGSSVGFDPISSKVTTARGALKALNDDALNINFSKFTDGLSFGLMHTADTAKRFEAQFKQMGTTLATTAESDFGSATNGFNTLVKQMGGGKETAKQLLDRMGPYKDQLEALAASAGKTASEQDLLNLAQGKGKLAAQLAADSTAAQNKQLAELSGVASQADDDISKLADQIRNFGSTQFDAESTESDFRAAIDDATAALKENGRTLDDHTEKGRANGDALRKIAQDGIAAAGALYENGASTDEVAAKMQEARDATIKAAEGFGMSGSAAKEAADRYKLIPGNVKTVLESSGFEKGKSDADKAKKAVEAVPRSKVTQLKGDISDAQKKIKDLEAKLSTVPKSKSTTLRAEIADARAKLTELQTKLNSINSKTITVTTVTNNVVADGSPGKGAGVMLPKKKAGGGYISGPGTSTSDSIPAMLSDGEYVIRAAAVQKYGVHTFDQINAARYASGGYVTKLASGGSVSKAQKAAAAAEKERQKRLKAARAAQYRAAAARRKSWSDVYDFNTAMRTGQLTGSNAVQRAFSLATDTRFPEKFRDAVGRVADQSEKKMLALEKRSTSAAAAVEKASSKLTDLKSSATSMASAVQSKLSDVSVGDSRSASSLLRSYTNRAAKLKVFQGLLTTLQKNGIAPALLNEIASLGVDEGMPLARSLAAASKSQIADINKQYAAVQSTSTAIGSQVADANFGKLIDAAERQLREAKTNASGITRAITDESRKLQKVIGRALGVPGYASGGYTGAYGVNDVAGIVHGREFVVRAGAADRHRALLEQINSGRPLQYMTPNAVSFVRQGPERVIHREGNHYNLSVQDPTAVAQAIQRREDAEYV
ncbi:TP901 family phage tail tape measure protein [Curtobacterium sp. 320]|uniref:phage tail tape measure protein n=1 Tax=Curtobacterium sp. 320 TaxID=2817749 RepID=UPI002861E32B|nr:phage tail tape measure protein [Curtobacterium sp. 320]MDR6574361.1 TP901 family phage tail tape measure protein [Curtobacterium sp. 320]